jgi:predicted AlkP superfamily pyrophosphatase or phosphodiesterase
MENSQFSFNDIQYSTLLDRLLIESPWFDMEAMAGVWLCSDHQFLVSLGTVGYRVILMTGFYQASYHFTLDRHSIALWDCVGMFI